jgi:hypothetical protein
MQKASIVVGLFVLLAACSAAPAGTPLGSRDSEVNSKDDNSTSKDSTPEKNDTSSDAPKAGSNNDGTGADAPTPAQSDCSKTEGVNECWFCCEDNVPAVIAAEKKIGADWKTCACQASACGSACANDYCSQPDPDAMPNDDKCEQCLSGNKISTCDDAADAAFTKLEADPIYAPAAKCATDNACDSKPSDD